MDGAPQKVVGGLNVYSLFNTLTYENYLLQEEVGDGGSLPPAPAPSFMLRADKQPVINAIACDEVRTFGFS